MSLRPRYSLLILTALVAGGVKLWYGPHHIVERKSINGEVEYSFVYDLRGNKIIQGPYILRQFGSDRTVTRVLIGYYRQGEMLNWICDHHRIPIDSDLPTYPVKTPLSQEEYLEFKEAITREVQKLPYLQGYRWFGFESVDQ